MRTTVQRRARRGRHHLARLPLLLLPLPQQLLLLQQLRQPPSSRARLHPDPGLCPGLGHGHDHGWGALGPPAARWTQQQVPVAQQWSQSTSATPTDGCAAVGWQRPGLVAVVQGPGVRWTKQQRRERHLEDQASQTTAPCCRVATTGSPLPRRWRREQRARAWLGEGRQRQLASQSQRLWPQRQQPLGRSLSRAPLGHSLPPQWLGPQPVRRPPR